MRGLRANEFRRDGKPYYQNGVTLKDIEPLFPLIAGLGWHVQLWVDARDLPDMAAALKRVPVPVVVDHMGRMEHRHGTSHRGSDWPYPRTEGPVPDAKRLLDVFCD